MVKKYLFYLIMILFMGSAGKASEQEQSILPGLNSDVVHNIFSFLKPADLWSMLMVNHAWHCAIKKYAQLEKINPLKFTKRDMCFYISVFMRDFFNDKNSETTIEDFIVYFECNFLYETINWKNIIDSNTDLIVAMSKSNYVIKNAEKIGLGRLKKSVLLCAHAASMGYLDFLQAAHGQGYLWNEATTTSAAAGGHLDCLQYAHEQGCRWISATCEHAAFGGHLDCLIYARQNGCAWDSRTCSEAAQGGRLDCLQYAYEQGCPMAGSACNLAAQGGHLDCLQYAYERGCPLDWFNCANAAKGGHLDCLIYTHENGGRWAADTCSNAAAGGHLNCLKYAREHGCPWDAMTYFEAARTVQLECLQYAYEQGCPCDEYARTALEKLPPDLLLSVFEDRAP